MNRALSLSGYANLSFERRMDRMAELKPVEFKKKRLFALDVRVPIGLY